MSTRISNKDAELYRHIIDDFTEKPDHETELATVKNLGLLIGALHCLNVVAFCSIVEYFHLQNLLKMITFTLLVIIGISLEMLKRKRAFLYSQNIILSEMHHDKGTRERSYKRAKSQFPMLVVTWAVAIVVAVFSGIGMAHFFIPDLAKAAQNQQYENAWKSTIQALDVATKENASLHKIKVLQAAVEKSKQDYELDKKNVDTYNAQKQHEHINEITIYALLGGGVGVLLESCLFLAIVGYFKKKYEIAVSLQNQNAKSETLSSSQLNNAQQAQTVHIPNANRQAT